MSRAAAAERRHARGRGVRRAAAAVAALVAVTLAGCHREAPPPAEGPLPPPDAVYRARGVVYQVPPDPSGQLTIFHEAIPDFVDRKGERSGMDSMTMPFSLAPEVPVTDLQAGDKVEIAFEVRWHTADLRIVELTELPPETELRLGAGSDAVTADPPAPAAADATPQPSPGEAAGAAAPTPAPAATAGETHH